MADPLAITLHASAAETVDGAETAVDLVKTLRTCLVLTLDVTAVSGTTPVLIVDVETSTDGVGWRSIAQFQGASEISTLPLIIGSARQYVRATWTITGSGASFTFSVSGEAHVLYAKPADMEQSISLSSIQGVSQEDKLRHCLRATANVETALKKSGKLPLTSWGPDVTGVTADRAVYYAMMERGFDPTSEVDQLILLSGGIVMPENGRPSAAEATLRQWASEPPAATVDQTPTVQEGAGFVISDTRR